jgi:hypothetical protein
MVIVWMRRTRRPVKALKANGGSSANPRLERFRISIASWRDLRCGNRITLEKMSMKSAASPGSAGILPAWFCFAGWQLALPGKTW